MTAVAKEIMLDQSSGGFLDEIKGVLKGLVGQTLKQASEVVGDQCRRLSAMARDKIEESTDQVYAAGET